MAVRLPSSPEMRAAPLGRFGKAPSVKQSFSEVMATVLPPAVYGENAEFQDTQCGGLLLDLSRGPTAGGLPQNCSVEVEHYSAENPIGRHKNEDRVLTHVDKMPGSHINFHILGVLDGHDTEVASDLISKLLPDEVAKLLKRGCPVTEAYTRAMSSLEEQLRAVTSSAGTCVLSCTIAGNSLWCSNLGDCRAILVPLAVPRNIFSKTKTSLKPKVLGIAWMSEDQKGSNPREEARILEAGGWVVNGRVEGLEPTRTLGDFDVKAQLKPGVISIIPEVRQYQFVPDGSTPAQAVLVIACDGVWDVLNGDDICNLIVARKEICDLQNEMAAGFTADKSVLKVLAEDLVQFSIAKGSTDDCTALVAMISVPGDPTVCETPSNAGLEPDTPMSFGRKFGY